MTAISYKHGFVNSAIHDCKIAPEFIEKLPTVEPTIADKGYDSEEVRETIRKNHLST